MKREPVNVNKLFSNATYVLYIPAAATLTFSNLSVVCFGLEETFNEDVRRACTCTSRGTRANTEGAGSQARQGLTKHSTG